jgi:two-component system sensor histidine kinase/response regulator
VLARMLGRAGAEAVTVANGAEGVDALAAARDAGAPFRVVVLDRDLPEEDRLDAAALGAVRVVLLTSATSGADASRAGTWSVAASLLKPVKESELLDAVAAALSETPAAPAEPVEIRTPEAGGRPLRILLAEDNPVNRKLAVRLLEKRGYSVCVANDGREALALLDRERVDLVLMDMQMPNLDGFQAAAAIRASHDENVRRLPIIAMTAHAMKGDRERCLSAGMDGYVAKPVQAGELFDTIQSLTALSRAVADRGQLIP